MRSADVDYTLTCKPQEPPHAPSPYTPAVRTVVVALAVPCAWVAVRMVEAGCSRANSGRPQG